MPLYGYREAIMKDPDIPGEYDRGSYLLSQMRPRPWHERPHDELRDASYQMPSTGYFKGSCTLRPGTEMNP